MSHGRRKLHSDDLDATASLDHVFASTTTVVAACDRTLQARGALRSILENAIPPDTELTSMSDAVDAKIESLGDWRGALLTRIRHLIKEAVPDVLEEVKWRKPTNPLGVPTWSRDGIICTGETYKDKIKLTFAKGSALSDPNGVFNAGFAGVRRAVDIRENEELDETALQDLVREAAAFNTASARQRF